MKRLTEVDMETLLNEAAPSGKKKKGAVPYTGRNREQIEKEVQALLGLADEEEDEENEEEEEEEEDNEEEDEENEEEDEDHEEEEPSPQPSTSQVAESETSGNLESCEDSSQVMDHTVVTIEDNEDHINIGETYTIIQDGSGPTIWTSEDGEAVVVTIADDGQSTLVSSDVQHHLQDIIQGEILMLE